MPREATLITALQTSVAIPPVWRRDLPLLFGLWLLASLFWIVGLHFVPYDSVDAFYPQSRFIVDSLRAGEWPWWNPYQYAGMPLFGDPQAMIFTLHTLVGVLLGPFYNLQVFDLVTLLHPLLGGLALYALGRERAVPRVWLLAGVLVFMLAGVATSRLQHVTQIISYGLLPVLLWALLALCARPRPTRALLLGVLGALWGANANQVVFLGGLLLTAVAVFELWRSPQKGRLTLLLGLAGVVALLLLAPIYAAVLEVLSLSNRQAMTLQDSVVASFPVLVYLSVVLPALFGNLSGLFWAPTDITQDYLYLGLIPLTLYALGLRYANRLGSPLIWAWAAALLFFVLYSLGVNAPLYRVLFEQVPGFDLFRRPADAAYLVNFLLALGLLLWGRQLARHGFVARGGAAFLPRRVIPCALLLLLPPLAFALGAFAYARGALLPLYQSYLGLLIRLGLLLALAFAVRRYWWTDPRARRFAVAGLALLITLDLAFAGRFQGVYSPHYDVAPHIHRYRAVSPPAQDSLDGWLRAHTAPWERVEVLAGIEGMGHASWARWHHTQGYNPLQLNNYVRLLGAIYPSQEARVYPEGSAGLLDQRYDVLGLRYLAFPTWTLDPLHPAYDSPGPRQVREYRDLLAQSQHAPRHVADGYEVWERPAKDSWLSLTDSLESRDLRPADCSVLSFGNTRIELSCRLSEAATLVMGEVYAPGWRACRNGQSVTLEPYFTIFRAVALPAGESTLSLRYRPVPFWRPDAC